MDVNNKIRGYIRMRGKSVTKLAEEIGTSSQALNRKLSNESIKYKDAAEIAEHLGYEIIWVDKEKLKPPEQ